MSIYYKNKNGEIKKIASHLIQRVNNRWFLCERTFENNQEYYDLSDIDTISYFKSIDPFMIYNFGFNEPNTTDTPKLRYKGIEYNITDISSLNNKVGIGKLYGVFSMFSQEDESVKNLCVIGSTISNNQNTNDNIGTKVYRDNTFLNNLDIKLIEDTIDTEINDRIEAINSLQSTIDTEINDRIEAINLLQSTIDTEINDRNEAINSLQSTIDTEINDRIEAIDSLQNTIDTESIVRNEAINNILNTMVTIDTDQTFTAKKIFDNIVQLNSSLIGKNKRVLLEQTDTSNVFGDVSKFLLLKSFIRPTINTKNPLTDEIVSYNMAFTSDIPEIKFDKNIDTNNSNIFQAGIKIGQFIVNWGVDYLIPEKDTVTTKPISFVMPFTQYCTGVATGCSSASTLRTTNLKDYINNNGFTIAIYRTNTTGTYFSWIAVGV